MTTSAQDDRRVPTKAKVEHPTVAERVARGQAARADVPRSAHAEFDPGPKRPDPVALLERQAKTRVPELVPIRYGRMLVSPFTFYRGAALIMASDLATTPTTGLRAQLCGDAHLSNFGVFGTPERRMDFDVNDFDETLPGPFEWDLKRLAASLEVAGRDRGFAAAEREAAVRACAASYRSAMAGFAGQANLEIFYARLDVEEAVARYQATVPRKLLKRAEKELAKARTKDSMQALAQAHPRGGRRAAHQRRPAADRADRRPAARRPGHDLLGLDPRPPARVPAHPVHRPPAPARALPLRRPGAQGGGGGQRGHAGLDRPDARPRRAATRCSCRSRRPSPRCWRSSPGAASTATPATAWSPASG